MRPEPTETKESEDPETFEKGDSILYSYSEADFLEFLNGRRSYPGTDAWHAEQREIDRKEDDKDL
jgi:hypothetical protein